jgi:prepilin-type N-terminal cleavage/methylation domain-containing protein
MPITNPMKTSLPSSRGFSLVELLTVITIISLLTSLLLLGHGSFVGGVGLLGAGDKTSDLFAFARQEAIAKNTMTAVVLVTSPSTGTGAYRAFSIWELSLPVSGGAPDSTDWHQTSRWQTLPSGIVVDSSASASSFLQSSTVSPALPTINYLGTILNPSSGTDCAVQYFMPSGRLDWSSATETCQLRLVEGFYNGAATSYQHPSQTNPAQPANYVSYIFSTATGEPKIVRP